MNILIISYAFPPDMNSQAQHVYGLYKMLSRLGNVDVLTSQKKQKINEKNIYYANLGKLHRMNNRTLSINKINSVTKKENIIYKMKNHLIPDPVIDWYMEAVNYYNTFLNKPYDFVIGIATPYTDLMIANHISNNIKKKLKKDCKIIQVYADPWYGEKSISKNIIRKKIELILEKNILKNANQIYMVTKNAKDYYIKQYPFINDKIDYYYLGHNFLPNDIKINTKNNDIIKVNYFGAIQSVHRNPYAFLEALDDKKFINKIEIDLYLIQHVSHQKIVDIINNSTYLQRIIKIKSAIPYKEMIQIAQKGDYNLIFGNSSILQIPGKLFDYIGIKSKIIYISNKKNDEIESILNKYNSIIVNNTKANIRETFYKIINKEIDIKINEDISKEMYRNQCYKKVENFILQNYKK